MKVLLTGAHGQMGAALFRELSSQYKMFTHSRSEFDLLDNDALARQLGKLPPVLIINAAAYTAVDAAQ